jgi:maltose O-acetyltransferase
MKAEREKMIGGELYNALDPALVAERDRARELCQKLNASREVDREMRRELLLKPFGRGETASGFSRRSSAITVRT